MDRKDGTVALSREPHVLVVGGSDSSGGAGLTRDIETIAALGVRTCIAITAVTVQTHEAVLEIHPLSPVLVADQMRVALRANNVAAIKVGVLATEQIIGVVAAVLRENRHIPAVLDPVLASSSGGPLLETGAIGVMQRELMPLCRLVTPNLVELAVLAGLRTVDDDEVLQQGQKLLAAGSQALLIKGGHAAGPNSTDILLRPRKQPIRFDASRLTTSMRGTGCMLASAIAAHLANARSLENSVRNGKLFVLEKLQRVEAA